MRWPGSLPWHSSAGRHIRLLKMKSFLTFLVHGTVHFPFRAHIFQEKHIIFRKKNISSRNPKHTRLYSLVVYAGLQIQLNHVKKHMSFWNKKHNHFQNSKHMPAYTMQLYTWAYKLNTKYPRICCGCICGIQSNCQIPMYTIWLYKRPTNKSSNSCVYNVVV